MDEEELIAKTSVQSNEIDSKPKSSFDSACPASTSKGLSRSSGDFDASDTISFCSDKCSCDSSTLDSVTERPCSIADSSTLLHKSKWKSFKRFISTRIKCKRKECKSTKDKTKQNKQKSSVVTILRGAATVNRVRRAGRHARVPFTATQASALEAAYARAPYLAPPALRALAAALQLRDDRIKIWFQNRRARERREKSVNITPPNSIALPPTTMVSFPPNSWKPRPGLARSNESKIPQSRLNNETCYTMQRLGEVNAGRFLNNQRFFQSILKEESGDELSDDLDIETVED